MTDLVIRSQKGRDVTTSLIVAKVFGKRHDNVLRDIESLSCSESFNLLNFEETPYVHPQNGQTYKMYEMTKDGFSFLVMGYTGEKAGQFKEAFINEFNRREMMLKSDDYILARSQEILRNRLQMAEKQLEEQKRQLELQAPKVLFAEAVQTSNKSILIGELAKILKQNGYDIGQNRLFEKLRNEGYLCKSGERYNQPTQMAMELGLFEIKKGTVVNADGSVRLTTTTKATGKGQVFFINKFLKEKDGRA